MKTALTDKEKYDSLWIEHGYGNRFQGFQNLMQIRIRDVLIVSSLYDLFLFEEDGRLYELIRNEYQGLSLSYSPELTRVSSGHEALGMLKQPRRFDLIITTLHIEDMSAVKFASTIKDAGINTPVILLTHDNKEFNDTLLHQDFSVFDRVFIWQENYRLILAIIKYFEDLLNIERDTSIAGVQSIILIEDNPRKYSLLLPVVYTEIFRQSQQIFKTGINLSHRHLRMRARPKIILCTTYEEAWEYFSRYRDFIMGIISDMDFPHNGKEDRYAGIEFVKEAHLVHPDIPALIQSGLTEEEEQIICGEVQASFLQKDSPMFIDKIRSFMQDNFGLGDFIFRTEDGEVVGCASNLNAFEDLIKTVPDSSIVHHSERNDFSKWLKAQTEFWLSHKLRPRKVADFGSVTELRQDILNSLRYYKYIRQRGIITDFDKETFDPDSSFARIGSGSLGGKARGLGFVNALINNYNVAGRFEGIKISVPSAVVVCTDVFDRFLDDNNLRQFAFSETDDSLITKKFLEADIFPAEVIRQLSDFLDIIQVPLAVRSSSLLEDSQYHPFAGVYETYMLPNNNPDKNVRLQELLNAVKRVYASTFYTSAKDYIKVTSYRSEEEKMAVIIQKMVGVKHDSRFYPDFSGVAKSYNFYPIGSQKATDGIVSVALGLGKTIVDGGNTVRFCPKYPKEIMQFSSVRETLINNQSEFYALDLGAVLENPYAVYDTLVKPFKLSAAEKDDTLIYVGSTYSPDNDAVYDGISRYGQRLVTFAPILKFNLIPLPKVLQLLLEMGTWGMGTQVEMEFAVNMSLPRGVPKEFCLLQMRPLVLNRELEELNIEDVEPSKLICQSGQVLGNGVIDDIYDIVVVDFDKFDRSKSREVEREVGAFNSRLVTEGRPYLLIGPGRWGSLDPWLGIPVIWSEIAGARVIIETGFKEFAVTPSQGTHFFQNITSFKVGYFTVNSYNDKGFVDWQWLSSQEAVEEKTFTRLLHLEEPVVIKMNVHKNKGIIYKPGEGNERG